MWSDPNLTPFMAVTAHWIQAEEPDNSLVLRADLIAFCCVPGRHSGEHLCEVFLHATDRLSITNKVYTLPLLHKMGVYLY
jgi:hypothetical protein